MKKKSANTLLNESIEQMEMKRDLELALLKSQAHEISESLNPINLIKNTFTTMTDSTDLKTGIGKTILGVTAGFLFKKMILGNTRNPLKKVAGMLLQTAVAGLVANNSDKIQSTGKNLLHSIVSKFKHEQR